MRFIVFAFVLGELNKALVSERSEGGGWKEQEGGCRVVI